MGKSRQEAVENAPLLKIAGSLGYFRVQCQQAGSSHSKSANSSPAPRSSAASGNKSANLGKDAKNAESLGSSGYEEQRKALIEAQNPI